MREQYGYREIMQDITEQCGGRRVLTVSEVAKYTGKDRRWCQKTFDVKAGTGISAVKFAMKLASL